MQYLRKAENYRSPSRQGIRYFEADKLHSELRNLVWYSIKFVVTK